MIKEGETKLPGSLLFLLSVDPADVALFEK